MTYDLDRDPAREPSLAEMTTEGDRPAVEEPARASS